MGCELVVQLVKASLIFIAQRLYERFPLMMTSRKLVEVAILVGSQTVQHLLCLAIVNCFFCSERQCAERFVLRSDACD